MPTTRRLSALPCRPEVVNFAGSQWRLQLGVGMLAVPSGQTDAVARRGAPKAAGWPDSTACWYLPIRRPYGRRKVARHSGGSTSKPVALSQ
jgi:hypothetical protein